MMLDNGFLYDDVLPCRRTLKADFHSSFSGARDFLRLIVDLGMRTYNKKARESARVIAKKS